MESQVNSRVGRDEAYAWCDGAALPALMREAAVLRDTGFGSVVTYSRKVFIPLTKLCRDVCHYCTFAQPRELGNQPISLLMRWWR